MIAVPPLLTQWKYCRLALSHRLMITFRSKCGMYVHNLMTIHCSGWPCEESGWSGTPGRGLLLQYIPRNMHTVFALLCFVVVIHWLIFPYPSGLLHWHCGNLTIAPVPTKQPWWIWINTSCEFIMNDCITTTKQSTTKPCAYFLGYTVRICGNVSYTSLLIKVCTFTINPSGWYMTIPCCRNNTDILIFRKQFWQ